MAYLDIKDLSFIYPDCSDKAIDGVSLSIERGEFVVLMGATGSGKSTLLRLLKPELRLNGDICGEVLFDGEDMSDLTPVKSASQIGFVGQYPEEQIVTDKVWHELAFTLENLGADRDTIARRTAEISAFFDIDSWYRADTSSLSGGQKQLLSLASVMTADPGLLILDEPTAQLDPITAARFIDAVYRLNRETGITVIISEHRSEELLPRADRLLILEGGRVIADGSPRSVARELSSDSPYISYLTSAARIYKAGSNIGEPALSIREGQRYLSSFDNKIRSLPDAWSDLDLTVCRGEVFALLGSNGAGKSTAALVASGLRKPYSGKIRLFGKPLKDYKNGSLYKGNISLLPQDVESVFIRDTVGEELKGCEGVISTIPYDLTDLFDRHPYDISGGERQLVALCKALATQPQLIIMDEPSKGLDVNAKAQLADIVLVLKDRGVTVLLISHDVEFAAMCADRCAMFSQGHIAACEPTERFLSGNRFYTTAASRITRGVYEGAYTVERALKLISLNGGKT